MVADRDAVPVESPRAVHPGGVTSIAVAEQEARRQIALRQWADLALRRREIVRKLRHPLFSLPAADAFAHFLYWLFW